MLSEYTAEFLPFRSHYERDRRGDRLLPLGLQHVLDGTLLMPSTTSCPSDSRIVPVVLAILFVMRNSESTNGQSPEDLILKNHTGPGLVGGLGGALGAGDLLVTRATFSRMGPHDAQRRDARQPGSELAVAEQLASGTPLIARGLGSSYGDAAQLSGGLDRATSRSTSWAPLTSTAC